MSQHIPTIRVTIRHLEEAQYQLLIGGGNPQVREQLQEKINQLDDQINDLNGTRSTPPLNDRPNAMFQISKFLGGCTMREVDDLLKKVDLHMNETIVYGQTLFNDSLTIEDYRHMREKLSLKKPTSPPSLSNALNSSAPS